MSKKISHDDLVKKALSNPKVKKEYNSLEAECELKIKIVPKKHNNTKTVSTKQSSDGV